MVLLKLSMNALSVGLPSVENSRVTLFPYAHGSRSRRVSVYPQIDKPPQAPNIGVFLRSLNDDSVFADGEYALLRIVCV